MSVRLLGRGSLGVLLIAAACVPAVGIAAASHTSSVPAQLVGHWKRTVSKADIKRTGGTGVPPNAHCNLSISKNGTASVTCTSIGSFPGTIVPAGTNRVHIKLGLPDPDTYTWSVTGAQLTFAHRTDDVSDRKAVFDGVWTRR